MTFPGLSTIAVALVLSFGGTACAKHRRSAVPDPGKDYDWRQAGKESGLDEPTIAQIERDGFCITNEHFKQIFSPYIDAKLPLLVTPDSILNGYQVLLEESLSRAERAQAWRITEVLRCMAKNLATVDAHFPGNAALAAAAKRRATLVLAVAMRLIGDDSLQLDPASAKLAATEVQKIESASGRGKPAWLGPPDNGFVEIDYTRYKPRGIYTKTARLRQYFRAISWLQSIPFRVENDEELVAILMLGNTVTDQQFDHDAEREPIESFFGWRASLLGPGDDWDVMKAADTTQNGMRLEANEIAEKQKMLLESARSDRNRPAINDQITGAVPADASEPGEATFRIVAANRLPDSALFQRTTDPRQFKRPLPTGLEVAAALGSKFARQQLPLQDRARLLEVIDASRPLFIKQESVYSQYLFCLKALLDDPEPDAPKFMASAAWRIKSCQTALAGWAQMRHAFVLQAKPNVYFGALEDTPPGFVEPVPEFYNRLATLIEGTEGLLDSVGSLDPDPRDVVADLSDSVAVLQKKLAGLQDWNKSLDRLSFEENDQLNAMFSVVRAVGGLREETSPNSIPTDMARLAAELKKLSARLEKGDQLSDPKLLAALRGADRDIRPLWRQLGRMCRRLETLSHKQLRGAALNDDENRFLRAYGEELAAVMLYGGNSYLSPHDDAPRAVDIYSGPRGENFLHVGIARPCTLYVLYPYKGGNVLCRGAVLPYYEFSHSTRLTDAEWKALLDSKDCPPQPPWIKPIVASGEPRKTEGQK